MPHHECKRCTIKGVCASVVERTWKNSKIPGWCLVQCHASGYTTCVSLLHASVRCIPVASDRGRTGSAFCRIATPFLFTRLGKVRDVLRADLPRSICLSFVPLSSFGASGFSLITSPYIIRSFPSISPSLIILKLFPSKVTRGSASCCLAKHSFKAPAHFHPIFLQVNHVLG